MAISFRLLLPCASDALHCFMELSLRGSLYSGERYDDGRLLSIPTIQRRLHSDSAVVLAVVRAQRGGRMPC